MSEKEDNCLALAFEKKWPKLIEFLQNIVNNKEGKYDGDIDERDRVWLNMSEYWSVLYLFFRLTWRSLLDRWGIYSVDACFS